MNVLIFGATGLAGGSVLKACLASPMVDRVHAITRRPLDFSHTKLRVFTHANFLDFSATREAFAGMDTCLFCLGISATQVSGEAEYRKITHDFAIAAAREFGRQRLGGAFHFISGKSTKIDSRMMWARVKGETERDLIALCEATCWRPGAIDGETSRSTALIVKLIHPLYRLLAPFPDLYVTGEDIGRAMLQATKEGIRGRTIENREIREIAARYRPSS